MAKDKYGNKLPLTSVKDNENYKVSNVYQIGINVPKRFLNEIKNIQDRFEDGEILDNVLASHVHNSILSLPVKQQVKIMQYLMSQILEN